MTLESVWLLSSPVLKLVLPFRNDLFSKIIIIDYDLQLDIFDTSLLGVFKNIVSQKLSALITTIVAKLVWSVTKRRAFASQHLKNQNVKRIQNVHR